MWNPNENMKNPGNKQNFAYTYLWWTTNNAINVIADIL